MFETKVSELSRSNSLKRPSSIVGVFASAKQLAKDSARFNNLGKDGLGYSLIEYDLSFINGLNIPEDDFTVVTKNTTGTVPEKYVTPKTDSLVSSSSSGQTNLPLVPGRQAHISFFADNSVLPTVTGYYDLNKPSNNTTLSDTDTKKITTAPLPGTIGPNGTTTDEGDFSPVVPIVPGITDNPDNQPETLKGADLMKQGALDHTTQNGSNLPSVFNPTTGKLDQAAGSTLTTGDGKNKATGTVQIPDWMIKSVFWGM